MRAHESLRLAGLLLALALLSNPPTAAAAAPAHDSGGPRFSGYPTERTAPYRQFDFAQLDGPAAPAVRHIADAVVDLAPLAQLQAVNRLVNRVPARDDRVLYGVDDYWATPREFFRNGGDCEDYAIAKYAILERLGWPPAHMWIVVLRETVISPIHAVLMVRHAGRLWTLDNLGDRIFEHGRIDYYRPALSLNRFGTWRHGTAPLALDSYRRSAPGAH